MEKQLLHSKLSFRSRLTITLGVFLIFIVVAMIVSIDIISQNYTNNYVIKDIKAQQNRFDQSVDSLLYDTNAEMLALFTEDNFYQVIDALNKSDEFQSIYDVQSLPQTLFYGVAYYEESKVIFEADNYDDSSSVLPYISSSYYDKVISSSTSQAALQYCQSTYNENGDYLIVGKKIEVTGQNPGVAFIYINEDAIEMLMQNILSTGHSILIDSGEYIVSSYETSDIGNLIFDSSDFNLDVPSSYFTKNIDGVKSFISVGNLSTLQDSFSFSWQVVSVESYDVLFGGLVKVSIILWITSGIAFLVAIMIAADLAHSLSKPLKSLSNEVESFAQISKSGETQMTAIAMAQPFAKIEFNNKDEISQLEDSYHQMTQRIYDLMDQNIKEMDEKRALELDSLQMQINPHFLYNTLDAIAWLAKIQKEDKIEAMVMSLAKFFRLTLHNGDKIISVGEEIELIQHYLEIEKVRFPDRFDMKFEVGHETEKYKTLKLILQPIVENSLKYGMNDDGYHGLIFIRCYKKGRNIIFEIEDNGHGFKVPKDIFNHKKRVTENSRSGFGLYNVNARIKLEYGEKYGVKISSKLEQGTKVVIMIPALN